MNWTKKQIKYHIEAVKILEKIIKEIFDFINPAPLSLSAKLCGKNFSTIHPRAKSTEHSKRCWIKNNCATDEYEIARFIFKKFKEYKIKTDHPPIVAFRENTQYVHYYPSQYCLKINTGASGRSPLLMIDLWGRINKKGAPFADITVMGYLGKNIPAEILKVFDIVINARDRAVNYLKKELKKEG